MNHAGAHQQAGFRGVPTGDPSSPSAPTPAPGTTPGWLEQVLADGQSDALVPELFDPPEPIALSPLDTAAARRAVFADMLAQCVRQADGSDTSRLLDNVSRDR